MRIIEACPGQETTYEAISSTGELRDIELPERFKTYECDFRQIILHSIIPASEYLDYIVSSEHIEDVGSYVHELWRSTKREAQNDPNNPYIGYGPKRVKVAALGETIKKSLGIAPNASPDADVYHPLDIPYAELEQDTKNKNAVPVIVLCNFLGDIVLDDEATLIELENEINDLLNGEDPEKFELLKKIHHIAFLAGEARMNARGYGEHKRTDFRLYRLLSEPVQELDGTTIMPVADWLLDELQKSRVAPEDISTREGAVAGIENISLSLFWMIENYPSMMIKDNNKFYKIAARFLRDITLDECSQTRITLVKDLLLDEGLIRSAEYGDLEITDQGSLRMYELDIANTDSKAEAGFFPLYRAEMLNRKAKKRFIEAHPSLEHLV